jgi:hypothetical protein
LDEVPTLGFGDLLPAQAAGQHGLGLHPLRLKLGGTPVAQEIDGLSEVKTTVGTLFAGRSLRSKATLAG